MEAVRRILNISDQLIWSERVSHLHQYSNYMRILGYSQVERYHAIVGAIKWVKEMRTEVINGDRTSLFRNEQ